MEPLPHLFHESGLPASGWGRRWGVAPRLPQTLLASDSGKGDTRFLPHTSRGKSDARELVRFFEHQTLRCPLGYLP